MPSRWQLLLSWEAVQERLGKVHKPVDVSEVRDQAERDPYCPATLPFFREVESGFTRARIAEAARAERDVVGVGSPLDHPLINERATRVQEIEGNRPSAHLYVMWAIDLYYWLPIAMMQRQERIEQPFGQAHDPLVDRLHAKVQEMVEADLHRWETEIVDRSIFKCPLIFEQNMSLALHIGSPDRSTCKPGALQFG